MAASKPSGGGGGTYDKYFGEIPPESTEFGWPLYITVPLLEETDSYAYYEKEPSDIAQWLRQYMTNNCEFVTDMPWIEEYKIYLPELYINGCKVSKAIATVMAGEELSNALWDFVNFQYAGELRFAWSSMEASDVIIVNLNK